MGRLIAMDEVIRALGMENKYPIVSGERNYVCPFCDEGDGKKKMNINFRQNVFRCNRCDAFKGNAVDFWAYYRGLEWGTKDARKKAAKDFYEHSNGSSANKFSPAKRKFTQPPDLKIADIETRHSAYSAFLNQLHLSQKHFYNLTTERGLSKNQVVANGYKTAPMAGSSVLAQNILNSGIPLEGVPGFYMKNKEWQFVNYGSGFLIPTRDLEGRIQALQFRTDKQNPSARYLTVSSAGRDHGTKGKTFPHFNKGDGTLRPVIITEGPLKGDIISYFKDYPTLAVLGVSSLNFVPRILKELCAKGYREFVVAYDMDLEYNKNVQKAMDRLIKMVRSYALTYKRLEWDINEGKGLDDVLFHREQYKI